MPQRRGKRQISSAFQEKTTMKRISTCCLRASLALVLFLLLTPARAANFNVTAAFSIYAAVAAAAASPDVDNTITITLPSITVTSPVTLGIAFNATRRLVIRPAATLRRAAIVSTAPNQLIFNLTNADYVTFQDLDIIRNITNNSDLIWCSLGDYIVFERCRIGSTWTTPGAADKRILYITYPENVLIRNCIFFARVPGTFDTGIEISYGDADNEVRLYNNVIADYKEIGIRIMNAIVGPTLVLLRNNVFSNHPSLPVEPIAFHTLVTSGDATILSSHNTIFGNAGHRELFAAGARDIAGIGFQHLFFAPAAIAGTFVQTTWNLPHTDPNPDLFRLTPDGLLNDGPAKYGQNVADVAPDYAVLDDIERDTRPTGLPAHTDRGADQIVFARKISGKVRLEASVDLRQSIQFEFRPAHGGAAFPRAMPLAADGAYAFGGLPNQPYVIAIKGAKWLRQNITVDATDGNVVNADAFLRAGDADDNNIVDVEDLGILIATFDLCEGDDGYDARADFNCNDCVDVDDLDLYIRNFDAEGDE
jgi:hypothetical protein